MRPWGVGQLLSQHKYEARGGIMSPRLASMPQEEKEGGPNSEHAPGCMGLLNGFRSPRTLVTFNRAHALRTDDRPATSCRVVSFGMLGWCSLSSFSFPVQITHSQQLPSFAVDEASTRSGCSDWGWERVVGKEGPGGAQHRMGRFCIFSGKKIHEHTASQHSRPWHTPVLSSVTTSSTKGASLWMLQPLTSWLSSYQNLSHFTMKKPLHQKVSKGNEKRQKLLKIDLWSIYLVKKLEKEQVETNG